MLKKILGTLLLIITTGVHAANPQLEALFESDWQWTLAHAPEMSTTTGDIRYNHKLTSTTLAAQRVCNKHQQDMLREALKIGRGTLSGQELISYEQFVYEKSLAAEGAFLYPYTVQPVTYLDGPQISFPKLVAQTPFNNAYDYHSYLARLHTLPAYVDGIIEELQQNMKAGWVAPRIVVEPVPAQLRELRLHLTEGVLYQPFQHIPGNVPKPGVFAQLGRRELEEHVAPALLKLENFITTQYLPACRDSIAASATPGGMAYYQYLIKAETSGNATPQELHDLGMTEVARLHLEMQNAMHQAGFKGSLAEFRKFLNSDPRFFYTSGNDLVHGFSDIVAHVYKALPTLFARLPGSEVGIRALPLAEAEQQPMAAYHGASDDGKSAGYLAVNVANLNTRPRWRMETLALHEAVPGRHLQISIAGEDADLPRFRRNASCPVFEEGWALYSQGLGADLGLYQDPYSKFGALDDENLRAARLVVDTGIHALGWSREQALAYLNDNTSGSPAENGAEVDRAVVRPARSLAGKIGQLEISALRRSAGDALGKRFDVRAFHNAVLENGPLPLPMLDEQINNWIAQQQPQPAN